MNRPYFSTTFLALVFSSAFFWGCKSQKKALAITSPPVQQVKAESTAKEVKPSAANAEEDDKDYAMKEEASKNRLDQYFESIANSNDIASANATIEEAINLFASPQTPVLIVISNENGQKDYDRPTSIKSYLNYLKDQKKNLNSVGQLKLDENGKITELELTKTNKIK